MRAFFAPDQMLHAPEVELNRGALGSPYERPTRASNVVEAMHAAGLGPLESSRAFGDDAICCVHDEDFIAFLQHAHAEWQALGRSGDAIPMCWPTGGMEGGSAAASLDARLGYYAFDIMTPITERSWRAARASADTALSGAAVLAEGDARSAFSLCRPPGHHAGTRSYGGYCFLNSAAIAAQYLRDKGADRVALLDVDYHHGNGSQQIFYSRSDVFYLSIHADPSTDFPFFSGYRGETGHGAGEGFNENYPLPRGTDWSQWSEALEAASSHILRFKPDALVVSLGVDTFAGDPLSHFRFGSDDFARLGSRIAELQCPTLLALEGGYAIDEIGHNVVRTLQGFEGR